MKVTDVGCKPAAGGGPMRDVESGGPGIATEGARPVGFGSTVILI
jgi:hypothetical protein